MESLKVEDYMNRRPVTFSNEMAVASAVEKLMQSNQSGGPVIDKQKRVIGFLSEQDCIVKMIESTYYREAVAKVSDIMQNEVISVKPYDSVLELAQKMAGRRPRVYPVVDDDGFLLGMIARHDVMKAIDHHMHDNYHMVS